MATKAELRLATYRILNEDDPADATNSTPTNTHFAATEIDDYIQQAITVLGTEMEWAFQISQAQSVQDQALYQVPSDFIEITGAYFDNTPLSILEREDLKSMNSLWQNAPSGNPKYLYKADNDVCGLYPAPDADHAGKAIQIEYIKVPATLTSDSDVPDLHQAFQVCLPFYAAYMAEKKIGNTKTGQDHFNDYEIHKQKLKARVQNWAPSMMRFRWGSYDS
jgi:hypothetical protein